MYAAVIRTGNTEAVADHAIWAVWNPHSTQRVKLIAFTMMQAEAMSAGTAARFRRTTARGTPGSSVSADQSNHSIFGVAPASGLVLDAGPFSVQPTFDGTSDLAPGIVFTTSQGGGIRYYEFPGGIEIGPGSGLACVQVAATALAGFQVGVWWLEDW